MFVPGDPRFFEVLQLATCALGPGLRDRDRPRWRELCSFLLGNLNAQDGDVAIERRRDLRAAMRLDVQLLAPEALRGLVSSSVGAGGLALHMAKPPAVGSDLELSIRIPDRPGPLLPRGRVVRVTSGGDGKSTVGVAFTNLLQSERELLEALAVKALLATSAAL